VWHGAQIVGGHVFLLQRKRLVGPSQHMSSVYLKRSSYIRMDRMAPECLPQLHGARGSGLSD